MSKDQNVDYYSDFKEAAEDNAVLVNIRAAGEKYPQKAYRKTRWNLIFQEDCLLVTEALQSREEKEVMKISLNQLKEVEVGTAKQFLGEFPGPFATTFLVTQLKIRYLLTDKELVLLCEGLAVIPAAIAYLKERGVPVRDTFSLEELFRQKGKETKDYLEEHFDRIAWEKGLKPAVYLNRKTV